MKYKVEGGIAHFGTDMVLGLTKDQADARAHALEEVGKGRYRPKAPVQFKAGEVLSVDCAHEKLPRPLHVVLKPQGGKTKAQPDGEGAAAASAGED